MTGTDKLERRFLNIWEALIVAALVGMGALLFRLNDSVTRLQVQTTASAESTARHLQSLQAQLADVPALSQRVSRLEIRAEAIEERQRELSQTRRAQ